MMEEVYTFNIKTSTMPSYFIKKWTKEPYAHTSLALDIELREMYSFARKGCIIRLIVDLFQRI